MTSRSRAYLLYLFFRCRLIIITIIYTCPNPNPSLSLFTLLSYNTQVLFTGVKNKLAPYLVWGVFIGLSENKKAYIVYDRSTGKTHISHDVVFYESGWVGPSKVHVIIPDPEESNEEMDVTVNAGPDLKVSQN